MEGPKRNYIAEVIDACMSTRKITNTELAAEIGITRVTLNALRKGTNDVMPDTLMKVATYFQWTEVEVGSAVWYADTLEQSKRKKRGKSR